VLSGISEAARLCKLQETLIVPILLASNQFRVSSLRLCPLFIDRRVT
jgi:hypothetical protein